MSSVLGVRARLTRQGARGEELIFVLVLISPPAKHLQSSCQTSRGQLFLNGYETRARSRAARLEYGPNLARA